jgi:hypothetical protein
MMSVLNSIMNEETSYYHIPFGLLDDDESHYYLPTGLLDDEEESHYYLPYGLLDDDTEEDLLYEARLLLSSLSIDAVEFVPYSKKQSFIPRANADEFIPKKRSKISV